MNLESSTPLHKINIQICRRHLVGTVSVRQQLKCHPILESKRRGKGCWIVSGKDFLSIKKELQEITHPSFSFGHCHAWMWGWEQLWPFAVCLWRNKYKRKVGSWRLAVLSLKLTYLWAPTHIFLLLQLSELGFFLTCSQKHSLIQSVDNNKSATTYQKYWWCFMFLYNKLSKTFWKWII